MNKLYQLNMVKMYLVMFSFLLTIGVNAQDVTLAGPSGCNATAASGTWMVPCDVTSISVEVYGAGGGGGGGGGGSNGGVFDTEGGGGAGAGGYTTITIDVTPGSSFSYSAGQGGCGGDNGSDFNDGDNGSNGGSSSFSGADANGTSVSLTGNGGSRGEGGDGTEGGTGDGGTGGSASGGTSNTAGTSGNNGSGGNGGSGGGAAGPNGGTGGIPNSGNGTNYGAGGAGGGDSDGGNGAPGAILITYETQGSFTPDLVALPATCSEDGSVTISNYDSGLTYNFFPSGPSVGAGGLISGATPGSLYTVVASVGACTSDPSSPFGVEEQLEAPIVEITGDLTVCEGATTTLSATGSTLFQWDDPASTSGSDVEVGAGTFTVTATNVAGCVSTASATVSEVANPQVDLGVDQQVCGQVLVTLDAGSGYASYLWSNGTTTQAAELESGTQWVEVSDGTCTGSDTIIITATPNPNPSISPNGAQVICDGGSLILDAGSGFASYSWEPNGEQTQTIEVTASGSYSLVVLDDLGCNGLSDTVTVTIENLTDVTILADGPLVFCEGDSVLLDAGSGYDTYLWSNGDTTQISTVLATGEYSVSGTSGGCEFGSDTVLTTVATVQVSITADETLLSVDAGFVSYQWFQNGAPIPGATTESYTANTNANYLVQVTDVNGCIGTASIEFTVPSSVSESTKNLPFVVYPNPSEGQFQLNTEFSDAHSMIVLNAIGQKVLEVTNPQGTQTEFNLETSGTYLLRVIVGETVYHKKLVVE